MHKMKLSKSKQMSESLLIAALLTLAGGFQDAYSYNCRGEVFANAQTGNFVLLGQSIAHLDFSLALSYMIPISAFICGIYLTERFHHHFKNNTAIHWRQMILVIQITMLIIVAILPQSMNTLANVIMSFTSAMQINSFRKFSKITVTTTLCTGNLRIATETLARYHIHKEKKLKQTCQQYYLIIFLFGAGAALGALASIYFKDLAILGTALLLTIAFLLMFAKTENKKERAIKKATN